MNFYDFASPEYYSKIISKELIDKEMDVFINDYLDSILNPDEYFKKIIKEAIKNENN